MEREAIAAPNHYLGNKEYQIRTRERMFQEGICDTAREFARLAMRGEFDTQISANLMQLGENLIAETGEVGDAARQIQEYRMGVAEDSPSNIAEVCHFPPDQGPKLQGFHRLGVFPIFRGDTPSGEGKEVTRAIRIGRERDSAEVSEWRSRG